MNEERYVRYMERSRDYYRAQGFDDAYRWACFEDVPFTLLKKPLAETVVTLVTTASLPWDGAPDERPLPEVYSLTPDTVPERLYTANRSWDKGATHTDDLDSYFPVHRLQELASEGVVRLAPRVHGIPTEYSQRTTLAEDAPELLRRCRQDGVEAAVFTPL